MGLLDLLSAPDTGNGVGGLLSYLQSPLYMTPKPKDDFAATLAANPYEGAMPQLQPQKSIWDQPGINYAPAPAPAAPSPFAVGAPSVSGFQGIGPQAQPQGQPPQQAAPAPQPAAAPAPAPQNAPINNMNVGGYQMPQFGSAADYTPQAPQSSQAPTDISAQSRGQAQQQQLPPALGGNSFGGNFGAGLQNFVNAGGPLQAIAGGLTGLVSGQRTDAQGMQQQNLKAQYDSLVPILGPQKALLAVMNPEAGKTLITEALTNKQKYTQTGEDAFGNKQYGFVNELEGTVNGKEPGQGGSASESTSGFLAPGVKTIDSSLKGKDYIGQFSPEVQAAVNDYVQGKSMPTGNPRKGFTQAVKMIAQKYGADTGESVDDATYTARRTMRNQLSSSAPSSLGGQINIGNTAAGHLADLSQKALELGNVDTGIAPLTALVNNTRGLGTEQAAKMEALKGAAQHYGQEITKFYAGSPGGTAERDRFIESVNGARSPKELAAILATEGELMRSRLDALGGQIKGVLGDEGAKQYPVLRQDGQAALSKVEENVSKLKGGQSAQPGGKPPTVIQNGHTYTLQSDGSYK